jgi:hypothetical protein
MNKPANRCGCTHTHTHTHTHTPCILPNANFSKIC